MTSSNFQISTSSNYFFESHWMRKKYVFDAIKKDTSFMLMSDSSLNAFYNINLNANMGILSEVDAKIAAGQYTQAGNLNSEIIPSNTIESNQKAINGLILQTLLDTDYVYTSADSITIGAIAAQCPLSGGNAVYQARNLLMTLLNNVIEFEDNCNANPERNKSPENASAINEASKFKLYPNPNNGSMLLDYIINRGDIGIIKIYDLVGKLIAEYQLNVNAKQLQISNTNLNNSVYMYHIIVNNRTVKVDKLVIIK